MIYLRNFSSSFRNETSQYYCCPCSEVCSYDLSSLESFASRDHRAVPVDLYVRSHAVELAYVHEPVLKNCFYHDARPLCHCQQSHERRLHVGRESRIWQSLDIGRDELSHIASHTNAFLRLLYIHSAFSELGDDRLEMIRNHILHKDIASCHRCSYHKCSGFYPVRYHMMRYAFQVIDAVDLYGICSCAFYPRPHLV